MKNQNILISFLQAFGILLVVMGHSLYQHEDCFLHKWIYSFHMPLFMFLSGYLLNYGLAKREISLAEINIRGRHGFVISKIKRLLIPYMLISTFAYFPKVLLSRFAARPIEASWENWGRMLLYPWDNAIIFFWFLPTLFLIFMIVVIGGKLIKQWNLPLSVSVLLVVSLLLHIFNPCRGVDFLNLSGVISYLFYFVLGYYCFKLNYKYKLPSFVLMLVTFGLSIVFVLLPNFLGKDILMAVNGILLSISLGKIYIENNCKFFNHLFGASYAIYLFSWFPQVLSQQLFLGITHTYWMIGSGLAIVTGIYIPLLIYRWILAIRGRKIGTVVAFIVGH